MVARRLSTGRRSAGLAGGLILAALFLCLLLPTRAPAADLKDVGSSDPWYAAVRYLSSAGVVTGFPDGTFRPYAQLNRGQAAKMLVTQRGVPVAKALSGRFTDLDAVYGLYVEAAAAMGWITGYPDGSFHEYQTLQRQHMAVILVRSLDWSSDADGLSDARVTQVLAQFSDRASISSTARRSVALAVDKGLFSGTKTGRFDPRGGTTRGQFSVVAYRAELQGLSVATGIRSGDHPDRTRVVVDLSRRPGTFSADAGHPGSLTIDVQGAAVDGSGLNATLQSDEVRSVAVRQKSARPPVARVTLTLARYSGTEVSVIEPSDGRGYRLVADVLRLPAGPPGDGPPLVCLDAGHGGSDSGAVGATGVLEKDVNLAITLAVDKFLRAAGLRTVLTRSGDTYPTLSDRAVIANNAHATIFVSIHNNASDSVSAVGTETFYQGDESTYSAEGKALAEAIQRNLLAAIGSVDRGARTHWKNLYVLNNTDMTAALTEVGFLTNAAEEAKLSDPAYQQKAARGIGKGVLEYLHWTTIPAN